MATHLDNPLGDTDLSAPDFWDQPAEVRDEAFAILRREAPISQHKAPEDLLGIGEYDDRPYWAFVRHEDVRAVSRDPETFCSSQGVQFGDAPPEAPRWRARSCGPSSARSTSGCRTSRPASRRSIAAARSSTASSGCRARSRRPPDPRGMTTWPSSPAR